MQCDGGSKIELPTGNTLNNSAEFAPPLCSSDGGENLGRTCEMERIGSQKEVKRSSFASPPLKLKLTAKINEAGGRGAGVLKTGARGGSTPLSSSIGGVVPS